MVEMNEPISHVDWIRYHTLKALDAEFPCKIAARAGLSRNTVTAIGKGKPVNLGSVVKLADALGVSVAEIMLAPRVPIEDRAKYKAADTKYLRANLMAEAWRRDTYLRTLTYSLGGPALRPRTIQGWVYGEYLPRLDHLQTVADALEMEVADLFIPPQGGED